MPVADGRHAVVEAVDIGIGLARNLNEYVQDVVGGVLESLPVGGEAVVTDFGGLGGLDGVVVERETSGGAGHLIRFRAVVPSGGCRHGVEVYLAGLETAYWIRVGVADVARLEAVEIDLGVFAGRAARCALLAFVIVIYRQEMVVAVGLHPARRERLGGDVLGRSHRRT